MKHLILEIKVNSVLIFFLSFFQFWSLKSKHMSALSVFQGFPQKKRNKTTVFFYAASSLFHLIGQRA